MITTTHALGIVAAIALVSAALRFFPALVFRGSEIFAPAGDTVLLEGDVVVAVVTRDTMRMVDKIFPAK